MPSLECPGLPANWLNGWLAAVGVTVLLPGARLSWSDEVIPIARIAIDESATLADQIARAIPTSDQLNAMAGSLAFAPGTARKNTGTIGLDGYESRAVSERRTGTNYLAGSVTDLASADPAKSIEKSAFNPAASGQTGGVLFRVLACLEQVPNRPVDRAEFIARCLDGQGSRFEINGLGFDIRRIPPGVQAKTAKFADPIVEFLAFVALAMFPVRGNGHAARTRGWTKGKTAEGSFIWPTWREPIDRWAIDGLLDRLYDLRDRVGDGPGLQRRAQLVGVSHCFGVVPFQPEGSDKTRAYGSRPLW